MYIEICFMIEGTCRIWRTNHSYINLTPNDILIIQPRTMHYEGWNNKNKPYLLLWLSLIDNSCFVFLSSYILGKPWISGSSISIINSDSKIVTRALHELQNNANKNNIVPDYLLQGGLLVLLSDMLHLSQYEKKRSGEEKNRNLATQVSKYIELHYAEPISITSLAELFRLSPNYLNKIFSRHLGMGIHSYLINHRLYIADTMLREKKLMVKEVAYNVGFTDPLYFSRLYKRHFGSPPSKLC